MKTSSEILFLTSVLTLVVRTFGKEIIAVNSTVACGPDQPLIVTQRLGFLTTPRFDNFNYYPANKNCSWILKAPEGKAILLRKLYFGLNVDCSDDALYLYEGEPPEHKELGRYCGYWAPTQFRSKSNILYLKFVSGRIPRNVGFQFYFEQVDPIVSCEKDEITCRHKTKCVNRSKQCDGTDDCGDGTDEEECDRNACIFHYWQVDWKTAVRTCKEDNMELLCYRSQKEINDITEDFNLGPKGSAELIFWLASSTCSSDNELEECLSLHIKKKDGKTWHYNQYSCGELYPFICCVNNSDYIRRDAECGTPRVEPVLDNNRIVGGRDAVPGSWPWQVSLRLIANEPYSHWCGGVLIHPQWLLTAGHCFKNGNLDVRYWNVLMGKHFRLVPEDSEELRYMESIHIHPEYKGLNETKMSTPWIIRKQHDIALIKLNAPVTFTDYVSPVCLPASNHSLEPGTMCYVTGWGETYGTGFELELKQAGVPVVSLEMCRKWHRFYDVAPSMICAGHAEGGQDSCQGDSGGPLVYFEDGKWHLAGIVSTGGSICADKEQPGIYTFVSYYVDWIRNVTGIQTTASQPFSLF